MSERVCFQLQVRPERISDYIERHRSVPQDVLDAIAEAGRRNYSIFLRDDGLLIGYYETDDDTESARRLVADPRTFQWEAESASFFDHLSGDRADQGAPTLREVFNLNSQLGVQGLER